MEYLNSASAVLFFIATTYIALFVAKRFCVSIEPFADGPAPGEPPLRSMYILALAVAVSLGHYHVALPIIGVAALVHGCLIAAWYSDVRCGILPDVFVLPPLIALIAYHVLTLHLWMLLIVAAIVVPFAFYAWRSKGLAMGWGDVKLAALGAALLGQEAFLTTMLSCLCMFAYAKINNRMNEPIAFGPYLIVGFEFGMMISGAV